THDEPCSMAPDDKHDLISGTCSHLPLRNVQKVSGVKGGSHAGSEWGVVVKAEGDEVAVQL
ncbi:hypothetical protein ACOY7O_15290, partial [Enterobacter roggenkampii]